MNVARPSEGLLSQRQTLQLLSVVSGRVAGSPKPRIIDEFAILVPGSRSRTINTLELLQSWKVLATNDLAVHVHHGETEHEWASIISDNATNAFANRIRESGAKCLQFRGNGELWLDSRLLPGPQDGLGTWLLEFGVASRGCIGDRFWQVADKHHGSILDAARTANEGPTRRTLSQKQLDDRLARQAVHGAEAEQWVLEFEKKRLKNHVLVDQVRQVSIDSVSEGYDILSFSSAAVLGHDLHIEVKSYVGQKRFYWSITEMETAKALGENYSLYLVDREQMLNPDYEPEIIRGPYGALFLATSDTWTYSPSNYEFVANRKHSSSKTP